MSLSRDMKLKDIALSSSRARQVLESAGLDYCCGGGKSLDDACLLANVSAEKIMQRLRESAPAVDPEAAHWTSASLGELTRHISEKHHGYVRAAIPRIEGLLAKVKARHGANHAEIAEIDGLFAALGREMILHMAKEEHILFPYIEEIEQAAARPGSLEPPFFQTVRNPIAAMLNEHDSAAKLMNGIRKASGDYSPPPEACTSYTALYQDLREFEADLHLHVHLENNILFPRAVEMEGVAR